MNEAQQEAEAHAKEAEQTGGQPKQREEISRNRERRGERAALESSMETSIEGIDGDVH